jgi:hypothetical protein
MYNSSKKINSNTVPKICNDNMNFQECEVAILRNAVEEAEEMNKKKIVNNDEIKKILKIVESFIVKNKLMLYGGIAINNILPKYEQFYNFDLEIPDYDFYSPDALKHAKELADIYYENGYVEVEAKAGVHMGTFKVFVNFIPIADITQLHNELYKTLFKDSIVISNMYYIPINYLRMSMYLELSRPNGDVSRWEKVFKRLTLINKNYPLKTEKKCYQIDFHKTEKDMTNEKNLYIETRNNLISQSVVFFGGYALSLYSKHMPSKLKQNFKRFPDFDVLSEDPDNSALILKEHLIRNEFKNIKIIKHNEIGEIIPYHNEISVNGKSIAFIFKPIACHSYNKIIIQNKEINIATIDTILSFYLSFMYANLKYYDKDRMFCLASYLFNLEEHNRLSQKGLLNRFTLNCYGKQKTLENIRSEKAAKYKELIDDRDSVEYEMWFLKYSPHLKSTKVDKILNEDIEKRMKSLNNKTKKNSNIKTSKSKSIKESKFIEKYIGTPTPISKSKSRKNKTK